MSDLLTGTVTFLFTDIEGSTQLLKRLGKRYGEALADTGRSCAQPCASTEARRSTGRATFQKRVISTFPRILAFVVLGLVRARRGDPNAGLLLDDALELAEPTHELPRIAPVAAARAEAAWLDRGPDRRRLGARRRALGRDRLSR
jgi:class 3 adenylate cyclase